jgi:hypothetical protein
VASELAQHWSVPPGGLRSLAAVIRFAKNSVPPPGTPQLIHPKNNVSVSVHGRHGTGRPPGSCPILVLTDNADTPIGPTRQHSKPGYQKFPLKAELDWQVLVKLDEKLILGNRFFLPIFYVDSKRLLEL